MTALKIAAVYAVAGALWILCSGWLLHHFVRDAAHAETLENVKGWFFVLVTATVLGVWLDRLFRRIRGATALLRQSEARFATIFKDSPMAEVITRLRDGVILDANESFSQLCRYPREELVGHTAAELRLWHSGNREVVLEDLRERGRVAAEMQGRDRNGETGDVLATFQLIELDGEPCVLGSLQDITERKRAERALRDNEERLRFSLESCHIGAWDLDLADDTAFCSMEHARIFGYDRPRSDWSRGIPPSHCPGRPDSRPGHHPAGGRYERRLQF
ncbi:MAG: PAS domain S-box protein [Kiritimatiellia bacterium]